MVQARACLIFIPKLNLSNCWVPLFLVCLEHSHTHGSITCLFSFSSFPSVSVWLLPGPYWQPSYCNSSGIHASSRFMWLSLHTKMMAKYSACSSTSFCCCCCYCFISPMVLLGHPWLELSCIRGPFSAPTYWANTFLKQG